MKTIIAGTRTITDYDIVCRAVSASGFDITEVVSGTARGVDRLGERWAREHDLPVEEFPADWERYGRRAGPRRNSRMAVCADALVAVWDGESRGTKNMIDHAKHYGLEVFIYRTDEQTQAMVPGIVGGGQ